MVARFERALRNAKTKKDFVDACRSYTTPDVMVDKKALNNYASNIYKPSFIPAWDEYTKPGQTIEKDFLELAASTCINAGYLYSDANGNTQKWEIDGSGAAALLAKMDEVRNISAIPGIDILDPAKLKNTLSNTFNNIPFENERLEIWEELASIAGSAKVSTVLDMAKILNMIGAADKDKKSVYHFDFESLRDLASALPKGFGADPYLKKAALLPILFAGRAHNKVSEDSVTMDIIIPSDYRVPQTLHNIGVLRFSDNLVDTLDSGTLLDEDDHYVAQIRAKTIVAVEDILALRNDLQMHHVDGELWFAGRLFDTDSSKLDEKKTKIKDGLEAIKTSSSFKKKGFTKNTKQPMNVSTMRF
jgi:hypothetical protein